LVYICLNQRKAITDAESAVATILLKKTPKMVFILPFTLKFKDPFKYVYFSAFNGEFYGNL